MIASRTTKSVMRMPATPSFLGRFAWAGTAHHLAGRGSPAAVLDLLFIAAQLAFELGEHQIDGRGQLRMALAGHEVVLVLGLHDKLYELEFFLHIDRHLDHGQTVEEMR